MRWRSSTADTGHDRLHRRSPGQSWGRTDLRRDAEAPSPCCDHRAKRAEPAKRSARASRDAKLRPDIQRAFEANFRVYGVRKVWRQRQREGFDVARCTAGRLMRSMGLQGVTRGKPIKTTIQNKAIPCPLGRVNRPLHAAAPNMLWVADFTYVATWAGFVHLAFVIDIQAARQPGLGRVAARRSNLGLGRVAIEAPLVRATMATVMFRASPPDRRTGWSRPSACWARPRAISTACVWRSRSR